MTADERKSETEQLLDDYATAMFDLGTVQNRDVFIQEDYENAKQAAGLARFAIDHHLEKIARGMETFIENYAMHLIDPCPICPDGNCECGYTKERGALKC